MNWFIDALKNAVNFSGRARRKAYWMFVLFYVIFAFVAGVLDGIFRHHGESEDRHGCDWWLVHFLNVIAAYCIVYSPFA